MTAKLAAASPALTFASSCYLPLPTTLATVVVVGTALGTVMTLFVLPGVLSLLLKAIGKGTSRASARPLEVGQLLRSQD